MVDQKVNTDPSFPVGPPHPTQGDEMTQAPEQLKGQVESLAEDIDDYLDENPVADVNNSVTDLDDIIKGAENRRSDYRSKHKDLAQAITKEEYEDEYMKEYDLRLSAIKKYILAAKEERKNLRNNEDMAKVAIDNAKERKLKFLVSEAKKAMLRLESVYVKTIDPLK